MDLRPGLRLESATCDTQVVVVKAPRDAGAIDLRCGGQPMRELGSGGERLPLTTGGDGTLLGKRYGEDELGLEVLCTQGGAGELSVGEQSLRVRGAKPLPSSD